MKCLPFLFLFTVAMLNSVFGEDSVKNSKDPEGIRTSDIEEYLGEDRLEKLPWEMLFDGPEAGLQNWRSDCCQGEVVVQEGSLSVISDHCGYVHNEAFGQGEFFIVAKNSPFSISLWESEWTGYLLEFKDGEVVLKAKRTGDNIPLNVNSIPEGETLYISVIVYRHLRPGDVKGKFRCPVRVRIKANGETLCTFEDKWLFPGLVVLHKGAIEKMFFRGGSSFHVRRVDLPDGIVALLEPASHIMPLNRTWIPRGW